MKNSKTAWIACAAGVLGGVALLSGCAGQSKGNAEFKEQAQQRMNSVKAATSYDMAMQQFLSGDLDKALDNVELSISLNETVAKSHVLRGRILIEMARLQAASESLATARTLDAQNVDALYYLAIVEERVGHFEEALSLYAQATEADPTNPQFPLAASEMLVELGRVEEAETLLNESTARFDSNAGIRQAQAHVATLMGKRDDAGRLFNEALVLAPDDPSILEDHARAHFVIGRYATAETSLRKLSALPDAQPRPDLRHLRARCLMKMDKPVEAREILATLVTDEQNAANAELWNDLGEVSLMLKDGFRLREAGSRLMSISPDRAEGYLFTALWQRDSGRLEQAVRTLDRAVERVTDSASPALLRGLMLADLGRHAEANESFALALRIDPANEQARGLLGSSGTSAVAGASIEE